MKLGLNQPESVAKDTLKKNIPIRKQLNEKRSKDKIGNHQHQQEGIRGRNKKKPKPSDTEEKEEITLTQITKQYNFVAHSDSDESGSEKDADANVKLSKRRFLSPLTLVQSMKVCYLITMDLKFLYYLDVKSFDLEPMAALVRFHVTSFYCHISICSLQQCYYYNWSCHDLPVNTEGRKLSLFLAGRMYPLVVAVMIFDTHTALSIPNR